MILATTKMELTPEQARLQQALRPHVLKAMNEESPYDMARDHLRYQKVRFMDPQDFVSLWQEADNDTHFDQLIDQLLTQPPTT